MRARLQHDKVSVKKAKVFPVSVGRVLNSQKLRETWKSQLWTCILTWIISFPNLWAFSPQVWFRFKRILDQCNKYMVIPCLQALLECFCSFLSTALLLFEFCPSFLRMIFINYKPLFCNKTFMSTERNNNKHLQLYFSDFYREAVPNLWVVVNKGLKNLHCFKWWLLHLQEPKMWDFNNVPQTCPNCIICVWFCTGIYPLLEQKLNEELYVQIYALCRWPQLLVFCCAMIFKLY